MLIKKHFQKLSDSTNAKVEYDSIEECPNCKKALAAQNLFGVIHNREDKELLSVADYCNGCHTLVVTEYEISGILLGQDYGGYPVYSTDEYEMLKKNHSVPMNFKERTFDEQLTKISPQFVKIYNQAKKAEEYALDEIAGLGYRKSLEFLIKDYAIYKNPDKEEEIKSSWMTVCLKDYIDNESIKTLAEKSEWIGNDEAHYKKLQDDRDVKDMKKFIDALVYFISMSLIVDDADSMQSKKIK